MVNGIINSSQQIVTNGLVFNYDVAQLRSYPTTGTSITDLSGNNNTGTLTNGVAFDSGNGGTLVFDGINDYISTNYTTALNDFTVTIWFKGDVNTAFKRLLDKNYILGFWLGRNSNGSTNSWGGGIKETVPPYGIYLTLNSGWNFLASIRNGTNHILYGNGITNTTSNTVVSTALSTNSLLIGKSDQSGGDYLKGNIGQVQIYNRALSSTEVLQNYNANRSRYGL